MNKKEITWRYLIHEAITSKRLEFTQKGLALFFKFSLSTINNALKIPRALGAIKVTGRNFIIQDKEKFLYLWATHRALNKQIIYSTHVPESASEMEARVPDGVFFACYSAYAKKFGSVPADYDKVYLYANSDLLPKIIERFPQQKGYANFFVLKSDPYLESISDNGIVPVEQIFADIWNLSDWYAKDFIKELREKLFS